LRHTRTKLRHTRTRLRHTRTRLRHTRTQLRRARTQLRRVPPLHRHPSPAPVSWTQRPFGRRPARDLRANPLCQPRKAPRSRTTLASPLPLRKSRSPRRLPNLRPLRRFRPHPALQLQQCRQCRHRPRQYQHPPGRHPLRKRLRPHRPRRTSCG
jgi:transglutaminase-like putative cysteine protease